MQKTTEKFAAIVQDPYLTVGQWKKKTGKRVIGCLPMHVPEEIIHAAGALPITLLGSHASVQRGTEELTVACHLVRGNLGLVLDGRLDFLDGIVFTDICDVMKWIPDFWNRRSTPLPYQHITLLVGKLDTPAGREYVTERFSELKRTLEEFLGVQITNKALAQSIATYNKSRDLLKRLYEIRRVNPNALGAKDFFNAVMAGMFIPKEDHNDMLTQLLDEIGPVTESNDQSIRLVLSGPLCDEPEWDIIDIIEDLGMVVADDDLYVGRRYFNVKAREDGDPLEALVERYANDVPCASKMDQGRQWANALVQTIKETNAKGAIISILKYCEVHGFDYLALKDKLESESIPYIFIEIELPISKESLRTRLQAFCELLEKGG